MLKLKNLLLCPTLLLCSAALRRQTTLGPMLQARLVASPPAQAVLAWGRKPSAAKAERLAQPRWWLLACRVAALEPLPLVELQQDVAGLQPG